MHKRPINFSGSDSANGLSNEPDALISTYGDRVYRFCLRLCGGRTAEAEDLTQDVFVLAWQNRDRFAGRAAWTTWLMRIALNRHLRLQQNGERQPDMLPLDEAKGGGASVASTMDPARQTLDRLELARVLDLLPPRQRAAFLLVKVEGLKYREAAETLGVPQGTVQSDVHVATLRLRTLLAEADALPAPATPSVPAPAIKEMMPHAL